MGFARILARRRLSESGYEVELERPAGFSFSPGQSVLVHVGGERRAYSMASSPSADTLLLLVRRIDGGAVSPALCASAPGTKVQLDGPHGLFTFAPSGAPAVLAATGVGIAPFLAMVRAGLFLHAAPSGAAPGAPPGPPVTLLQGARTTDELFGRDELAAAGVRYVACLSREKAPACYEGRVTGWSRERLSPGRFDFYLCGRREMVQDMTRLVDERLSGSRVYTEIFF